MSSNRTVQQKADREVLKRRDRWAEVCRNRNSRADEHRAYCDRLPRAGDCAVLDTRYEDPEQVIVVREYTAPPNAPERSWGFYSRPGAEVFVVDRYETGEGHMAVGLGDLAFWLGGGAA